MDKDELKKRRREAYQKAKARRDADPRYQELKEKIKQQRKAHYRALKDKRKQAKEAEKQQQQAQKEETLKQFFITAKELEETQTLGKIIVTSINSGSASCLSKPF